jgi:hypothetical protein
MKGKMDEVLKINQEIEIAAHESTVAIQSLKDTFSTLKGKTNLNAYPTESESGKSKAGTTAR